jgi:hypothetical protein
VAKRPGEVAVAGWAQVRRRRNCLLVSRTTILGRRLAGIGRSPVLCCVVRKKGEDNMLQKCVLSGSGILKVFYIDVAKVDRDVTHIVMDIHVCFKYMFQMCHLFQINAASVLSG